MFSVGAAACQFKEDGADSKKMIIENKNGIKKNDFILIVFPLPPPMECEIKIFANRSLEQSEQWDEQAWTHVMGNFKRREKYERKYPGYLVYELQIKNTEHEQIVPCKASVFIQYNDQKFSYLLKYETVQVHDQCPTVCNKIVLRSMDEKINMDHVSSLSPQIWKQLGKKKDSILFLSHLSISSPETDIFGPSVRKDNVTGEYYAYDLTRVLMLQKKQ